MTDESPSRSSIATPKHSALHSSFPVLLPEFSNLVKLTTEFALRGSASKTSGLVFQHTVQEIRNELQALNTRNADLATEPKKVSLTNVKRPAPFDADDNRLRKALFDDNKTLTQNADITHVSSQSPLVDLFYELGENMIPSELEDTLTKAWNEDALLTLKIIFNTRSIHLGKSSRVAAYSALGWLAHSHPNTFLANLQWLVHPVIEKKSPKSPDSTDVAEQDDFEIINIEDATGSTGKTAGDLNFRHGVSHGYWKDLLNLVVFAANDQLKINGNFSSILSQHPAKESKRKRGQTQECAKKVRRQRNKERNERVQEKLRNDSFYRALHVRVVQLFSEQLKCDKALLESSQRGDLQKISLAAKWVPSFGEFHDKHTFLLSSLAENLFPDPALHCPDATNRELYLRHVRELFRVQYSSPLRKALGVVERDITAERFENIDYSHVPSLAMNRYTDLFIRKDSENFTQYIEKVSLGQSTMSGATLLPSTLVRKACESAKSEPSRGLKRSKSQTTDYQRKIQRDVIDSQWKTLVGSVRNAGALQSSIAVCDVSGSMFGPAFKDGTTPLHSAIGLSLLIAQVTAGPFGDTLITFSQNPQFHRLKNAASGLCATVGDVQKLNWGMNTDLVAVFVNLLEKAEACKVSQDDMVKQVFVFSDMQFDQGMNQKIWNSSFDRIKTVYAEEGYDMPKLIFWNLAGATNKPVTVDDKNTALVSGYSHGMLKAFLETGALESAEEIVERPVDGDDVMVEIKKVETTDPLMVVKRVVEHKAYSMLTVVD